MIRRIIKEATPSIKKIAETLPGIPDTLDDATVEGVIAAFVQVTELYTDLKEVHIILRVVNQNAKEEKVICSETFLLQPTYDNRKYSMGDEVSLHESLDGNAYGMRPRVMNVVHYAYMNQAMDIELVKGFGDNQEGYDAYIKQLRFLGWKTVAELKAENAATDNKSAEDVPSEAPSPTVVES